MPQYQVQWESDDDLNVISIHTVDAPTIKEATIKAVGYRPEEYEPRALKVERIG